MSQDPQSTIRFGILTISDRSYAGLRDDLSGPALSALIEGQNWRVEKYQIVPDELDDISSILTAWADGKDVDVILTTGGTGFAPRDITPEATLKVIQRRTPGIVEAIRSASLQITSHAMLSRAEAGIRGRTLIVNFPGSPKAVSENFEVLKPVLPHAVSLIRDADDSESGHLI